MSVSVNTSFTGQTRLAVGQNLDEAKRSMIAMSTGNAIGHAFEDPTGLAIGSNMKSTRDILSVVATGIEQSKSMLYMAEAGLKSAEDVVNQMETMLARAKLGYMTDELILNTLSPAYKEMKEELNRIADSIDFNGQKLLNGTGGKVTYGKGSTVSSALTTYNMSNAVSAFRPFANTTTGILTGVTANTIDNDATPQTKTNTALIVTPTSTAAPVITGGTLVQSGADYILTNATITINDVLVKDTAAGATNPQNSATADLVISGVTLKFANATLNNGVLISPAGPTVSNIQGNNILFKGIEPTSATNGITDITSIAASNTASITLGATGSVSISNIDANYESTGGSSTVSTFNFVTGTDLANDVIKVNLPNISLVDSPTAPSVIRSLNVSGLKTNTMPTGLTDLVSVADADKDIPLIAALREQIVTFRNALGAYQLRFINLSSQLSTAVEQVDAAQGAILNADLPVEAEAHARAKVNLNLSIAMLNESNRILENLQKIVTG
jgi:flagellin